MLEPLERPPHNFWVQHLSNIRSTFVERMLVKCRNPFNGSLAPGPRIAEPNGQAPGPIPPSLLYGLPSREIEKLQRLQNTAARLTVCMKKTDHITPVLKKLHWLPVNDRITFKLLLLTYKSLNGLAPVYINELLHHYTPCRSLRSSDSNFLAIPKTTTITYGDRSFAAIAPKLWNQLPLAIRQSDSADSFKRAMKTYLFRESSFFEL